VSAKILDGRVVASRLWRELSARVEALQSAGAPTPRLAVVRFDERGPSAVYAASLARAARSVGIEPVEVVPPEGVQLSDLAARIGALNRDPDISGILVAQPLPAHLAAPVVLELIDPAKDVDGATPLNAGRLARGDRAFVPATALAVMALLHTYQVPTVGRRAVVIGRSAVVGRPVASLLLAADATVQITHRRTRNTTPDGLVGDVDFAAVRPVVSAITPVPGGVGPVTTMMLLQQTVEAAERRPREAGAGWSEMLRTVSESRSDR
jgi:methylenetetrahydrofolate dehydrogenase (NADP+)/methenyltetrahydrofolate cyclohydrolase